MVVVCCCCCWFCRRKRKRRVGRLCICGAIHSAIAEQRSGDHFASFSLSLPLFLARATSGFREGDAFLSSRCYIDRLHSRSAIFTAATPSTYHTHGNQPTSVRVRSSSCPPPLLLPPRLPPAVAFPPLPTPPRVLSAAVAAVRLLFAACAFPRLVEGAAAGRLRGQRSVNERLRGG